MALQNSIQRQRLPEKAVTYEVNGAQVKLSPAIVRNYLTNGDGRVSDQEVAMFINLCRYQGLNPLIKDAYLIKYGNQPATIVTSKDAIMKRAMRNERYAGHQAGVIVQTKDGTIDYRTGAFSLPGEVLIGGWARTYVKGFDVPIEVAVSFEEYAGRKRDGSLNSMWASKPGVMIRKVALTASLREAFPEQLQGMYASEEVGSDVDDTMVAPVNVPDQPMQPRQPEQVVVQQEPEDIPEMIEPEQTPMDELEGVF